jgi:hypothetical protein
VLEPSSLETTAHRFLPEMIITATSHLLREHLRFLAIFLSGRAHTRQLERYCAVLRRPVLMEGKGDPVRFKSNCILTIYQLLQLEWYLRLWTQFLRQRRLHLAM